MSEAQTRLDTEDALAFALGGATRLYAIIGDPIAQVRAPAGITKAFVGRGHRGVLVPIQVAPDDLSDFVSMAARIGNFDGMIITVPHKVACSTLCTSISERSRLLGAVNLMRKRTDGGWHGDMADGIGFLRAVMAKGFDPVRRRALVVGAGGAGSAIALALIEAGIDELGVHDEDPRRRDRLIGRLNGLQRGRVAAATNDPAGYDLVANATPAGMAVGDPLPVDVTRLAPSTMCGCVITKPEVSPFIAAARQRGCVTATGGDMYLHQQELLVDFLLFTP